MGNELPQLIVADAAAWRTWLGDHHDDPAGVWLILAKHLFGVRGGEATLHDSVDWATILASPTPAGSRGTSRRG